MGGGREDGRSGARRNHAIAADAFQALVRHIEDLALRAWPPAVVQDLDGWRLRYDGGVTQRANSVWPNGARGRLSLEDRLRAVEEFYRERELPALYQLTPASLPSDLDAVLARRGYRTAAPTSVQTASIDRVLERTESSEHLVTIDSFHDEWFEAYCEEASRDTYDATVRRGILQRIEPGSGYATLCSQGRPVAVGLGVVEAGWVGIFCMATLPAFRRQGAGAAVLRSLAEWGRQQGAEQVYLQVTEANVEARPLYAKAGFEMLYTYHYRVAE